MWTTAAGVIALARASIAARRRLSFRMKAGVYFFSMNYRPVP